MRPAAVMTDNENIATEKKKKGLGRGLNALFEDDEAVYPQVDPQGQTPGAQRRMAGIDQLEPGPWQPRQYIDSTSLDELAESIATHGVLQPILVRQKDGVENRFQIVAGERRWRAAQKAQLHEVPIIVKEMDEVTALEIALIENLQRSDLNALEEAQGYKRLMDEFGHTQEKLAAGLGKSRSHIANMIRLLNLPPSVQVLVRQGKLSAGHARALITSRNPDEIAKAIMTMDLSVRETERLVNERENRPERAKKSGRGKDVNTLALEKEVSNKLGMKVMLDVRGDHGGVLKIEYKSLDQLDDLLHRLSQNPHSRPGN